MDEFFWVGIFALQGIIVDMLIILIVLFSALFFLHKWINYKLRAQRERARPAPPEHQEVRESIAEQMEALLQELEGF